MEENPRPGNTGNEKIPHDHTHYENELKKENNGLIIALVAGGVVVLILGLYFLLSGPSHYEKGQQFLREKQYSQALSEFEKVDAGDTDFRMAQSKIYYINGLRAFNDGLKNDAKRFLVKVDPSDEYYNEARLMIDKIDMADKQGDLEKLSESLRKNKDTVVIREKVIDTLHQKVNEADSKSASNSQESKSYVANLQNTVKRFESLYQSARTANLTSKKDYYRELDSLYNKFLSLENQNSDSHNVSDLKQLSLSYMSKRMEHINKLISENLSAETNDTRFIKEDGDKIYSALISQLNNKF